MFCCFSRDKDVTKSPTVRCSRCLMEIRDGNFSKCNNDVHYFHNRCYRPTEKCYNCKKLLMDLIFDFPICSNDIVEYTFI